MYLVATAIGDLPTRIEYPVHARPKPAFEDGWSRATFVALPRLCRHRRRSGSSRRPGEPLAGATRAPAPPARRERPGTGAERGRPTPTVRGDGGERRAERGGAPSRPLPGGEHRARGRPLPARRGITSDADSSGQPIRTDQRRSSSISSAVARGGSGSSSTTRRRAEATPGHLTLPHGALQCGVSSRMRLTRLNASGEAQVQGFRSSHHSSPLSVNT